MNKRINAILDRLISVKLWTAVGTVVLVLIYGDSLSPELKAEVIGGIGVAFVIIQGLIDAFRGQRSTGGE